MKKSNIGFPYPVLCADNNDYVDSLFAISTVADPFIENNQIKVELKYELKSAGLCDLLNTNNAQVVLYCESPNSSFRSIHSFPNGENSITVIFDATRLSAVLKLKGMIVAKSDYDKLCFDEHNHELFERAKFTVHKGDILAISNIFEIELNLIDPLANRPSIFSIRPDDEATQSIRVELTQPDRINIWLKRDLHNEYQELREEPKIRTLLASHFVLPALVEALNFMMVDAQSGDYEEIRTGAWYQSLDARIQALGINLAEENSMASVANAILNDIIQESMNNFKYIKENLAGN